MKKLLILLFSTLSIPAFASDCTLDQAALTSTLNTKFVKTIEGPKRDKETTWLVHTAKLNDGTIVKYSTGGCTHYGFTYEFKNIKNFPQKFDAKTAALINSYFDKLHIIRDPYDTTSPQDMINKILAYKSNETDGSYSSPYGDAFVVLYIKPDGFQLEYSFVL
jgi:hypothetical protein